MSRADQTDRERDAVKSAASQLVQATGGALTQEQAQRRVAQARERGDRIRENGNR